MFRAGPQAPDIGPALLTMLRTVAGLRDRAPRPWTGSWTEPSVQPVRSGPSAARLRGIPAASANDARSRTSHNPPVVGSSPTRPTHFTFRYATTTRHRFPAWLQFWLQLGSRLTPQRLADPL